MGILYSVTDKYDLFECGTSDVQPISRRSKKYWPGSNMTAPATFCRHDKKAAQKEEEGGVREAEGGGGRRAAREGRAGFHLFSGSVCIYCHFEGTFFSLSPQYVE